MGKSKIYHIYPTMKCNLSCQHCFLHQEIRDKNESMSSENFRLIVDKLSNDFMNDIDSNFAEITILGGEPTLVQPSFYLENIPYLRKRFSKWNKSFSLTIVTNFSNTNALKRYAHLFDVVSTSYEWDRFESQLNIMGTSKRKKTKWWKNLYDWRKEGRSIAISIGITSETITNWKAMFETFYELGIKFFQVNLMHPDGELMRMVLSEDDYEHFSKNRLEILTNPGKKDRYHYKSINTSLLPSFEEEAKLLISLTQWMDQKADKDLIIYPISSHKESIRKGVANSDIACPAKNALCVTTSGNVSSCTIEAGKMEMISYGNIYNKSLDLIINSELRERHVTSLSIKPVECLSCEHYYFCQGGCSFRELFWNKIDPKAECHGLRSYFEFIAEL